MSPVLSDLVKMFSEHPALFLSFLGLIGLCVGSFLNVVILRYPARLEAETNQAVLEAVREIDPENADKINIGGPLPPDLVFHRSHCPKCGHQIRWFENIPVLSWLALRGKCSSCKSPISPQYPLVEALTAGLFVLAGVLFGPSAFLPPLLVLIALLVGMSGIDWKIHILPDEMVYPSLWIGLLVAASGFGLVPVKTAVFGAFAGYMTLWCAFWLFRIFTGKDGMGRGDFKLLAVFGAWAGMSSILPVLLVACLVGVLAWLVLKMFGRASREVPMAFGPCIALAGLGEIFWNGWLWNLFGVAV